MNTLRPIFILAFFAVATASFAQPSNLEGNLKFSLQKITGQTWGVFVMPNETITPSRRTVTGTGQVTLVTPVDFKYSNLTNEGGSWVENARVDGPIEAYDRAYISFGFVTDSPKLDLFPNTESLLFTIEIAEEYEGMITLFENGNDPFSVPNSFESNPGNDLAVIDYGGQAGIQYYTYDENYTGQFSVSQIMADRKDAKNEKAKALFTSEKAVPKSPK